MGALLQAFKDMGQARVATLGAVLIIVLGTLVYFSAHVSSQSMSPIYTDLSVEDSAKIVAELDKQNVPYELRGNGTQILVPTENMLRLRLSLAQQGLPSGGSIVGYEIFDRSEAMGTSSFVMNVNMLRALEGELARTIASLAQVENARVHLVVPKQEIFAREKQEPTASVVIKLRGMSELGKEQISGITHIIAASVPGLKPSKVALLDNKGHLLSGGNGDDADGANVASNAEEYRITYQARLKNTLESMLEKTLGFGKVKVTVSADIDFDRIVINSETFDPNGQVARSVQSGEEKEQASDREGKENTTASNNLPNAQANQSGNNSNRVISKSDETTNYEISKTVQNHVKETGKVNKLSVAVMVDGTYADDKAGKPVYTARSDEDRKQIETLVKTAIGFDEKRGDNVEVVSMKFASEAEENTNLSFLEYLKQDVHGIVQTLVFGGVAALVILMVIRPVVNRIIETTIAAPATEIMGSPSLFSGSMAAAPAGAGMGRMASGGAGGAPRAGMGEDPGMPGFTSVGMEQEEESTVDLSRVTGKVKSSTYNRLNELVERHPEEALNVIRIWSAKRA